MIRVQLKKRFDTKSEASRFLMCVVDPGDEQYFELMGKEKNGIVEKNCLLEDLKNMGLVGVCNREKSPIPNGPARLYRAGMRR